MAGSFPTLSHGETTQSGLVHSLEIRAEVQKFFSGTEQRYAVSGLLNKFDLAYQDLKWADVQLVRDFFILQKGSFDHLWSLDLKDPATDAVRTYDNLAFDKDEFSVAEPKRTRYSLSLPVVQTVGEPVTVSLGSPFPKLRTEAIVQFPSTASFSFRTFRNDLEAGKRVSYYAWPDPLRTWPLEFSMITNGELQAYVQFYLAQGGPVNEFTFTDPDTGTAYEHCRFAPEPLKITRVSRDLNKLSCTIEQYKA